MSLAQSVSRSRKKRPVAFTSNSFSIVSESAVNAGPVTFQLMRSWEDSSTYRRPKTTLCVTLTLLTLIATFGTNGGDAMMICGVFV